MKKVILTLGLLFMVAQTNCGLFDQASAFLKKSAGDLLETGKKYVTDNSDKILSTIKEQAGTLFDTALNKAKEMIFGGGTKKEEEAVVGTEAKKEEEEIVKAADDVIKKTPGLTLEEQQALLKEAGDLAKKNRIELEKTAMESVEKKRAALKQSMYDRFGKGTPTK